MPIVDIKRAYIHILHGIYRPAALVSRHLSRNGNPRGNIASCPGKRQYVKGRAKRQIHFKGAFGNDLLYLQRGLLGQAAEPRFFKNPSAPLKAGFAALHVKADFRIAFDGKPQPHAHFQPHARYAGERDFCNGDFLGKVVADVEHRVLQVVGYPGFHAHRNAVIANFDKESTIE